MNNDVQPLKDDENQQAIPDAWRQTFREIVDAFKIGDFRLRGGVVGVRQVAPDDADRIARNIMGYGAHLASLPEETWRTSACQWMRGYWDVLIDLYTDEEGASDLALSVRVYEAANGFEFQVESVHVP